MPASSLCIRSGQGHYEVEFPASLEAAARMAAVPGAVVFADRKVAELHRKPLAPLLDALPSLLVDATEDEKSLPGVLRLVSWMQGLDCTRQSVLVVAGGGIVQDIAAFSAHIYYRGIRWVFLPTTLLAMSDSCIGAKCAINLNAFKNQLGAFHSPARVLVCTDFVETLSDADVASGYGEILKLALTGSEAHLERLERTVQQDGLRGPELPQLVRESLQVKQAIIEEDEYERDRRRILNYGHTFGHALESVTGHAVPHGLAVAWGCDLVNWLSMQQGLLSSEHFERVHRFLARHLPFRLPRRITAAELMNAARRDKKASGGHVQLILLERPGALKIVRTPLDAWLEAQLENYLQEYSVFECSSPGDPRS